MSGLGEFRSLLGASGTTVGFDAPTGRTGGFDGLTGGFDGRTGRTGGFDGLSGRTGGFDGLSGRTGGFDGRTGATGGFDGRTGGFDNINIIDHATLLEYFQLGDNPIRIKNLRFLQQNLLSFSLVNISQIQNLTSQSTSKVRPFGQGPIERSRNLGNSGPLEEILKVKLSKILNPLAEVCLKNKFGLVMADNSDYPHIMIDEFGKVLYLDDQEGSTKGTWIVLQQASANNSPESDSDAEKWAENFSKAVPKMIEKAPNDVTSGVTVSKPQETDFTPSKKHLKIYANRNDQSYTVQFNNESINYDYVLVHLPKEFQSNTLMLFKEELKI